MRDFHLSLAARTSKCRAVPGRPVVRGDRVGSFVGAEVGTLAAILPEVETPMSSKECVLEVFREEELFMKGGAMSSKDLDLGAFRDTYAALTWGDSFRAGLAAADLGSL